MERLCHKEQLKPRFERLEDSSLDSGGEGPQETPMDKKPNMESPDLDLAEAKTPDVESSDFLHPKIGSRPTRNRQAPNRLHYKEFGNPD